MGCFWHAVCSPFGVEINKFGLVCIPFADRCRYRAITRTRYLSIPKMDRAKILLHLYWDNLMRVHTMLGLCDRLDIRLYRIPSSLFPMSDEPLGSKTLYSLRAVLSSIGRRAERLGIRVIVHPDQFVVLSSESPAVAAKSVTILKKHGLAMDLMGFPRSPWAAILVHGGKAGRADALVEQIAKLPDNVRARLCLENDEFCYSSAEILAVCRRAGVPMIFDNHHHAIHDGLTTYNDTSVARCVADAATTWPDPAWQVVHLSNGRDKFADRRHSDFIADVPPAYADVPWIEVEAKGKEVAIAKLRDALSPGRDRAGVVDVHAR